MPADGRRPVAVITGASSGIGRAFAEQIAEAQHDLVLVARTRERLERLANELRERHRIEAFTHVADLEDARALAELEARLRATPPDLLVNSAGFGTAGAFSELPIEREDALLRVNVIALVRLTHACLPGMLARGSGGIINVSSLAGEVPSGFNATYGGSKAFVTSFTQALYEELAGTPVRIQCLLPGLTRTEWAEIAGIDTSRTPDLAISDPKDVAAASLAALASGRAVCVPGLPNRMLSLVQRVMPRPWMRRITARATRGSLAKPRSVK
jgi:short-subunit dehydrogenase